MRTRTSARAEGRDRRRIGRGCPEGFPRCRHRYIDRLYDAAAESFPDAAWAGTAGNRPRADPAAGSGGAQRQHCRRRESGGTQLQGRVGRARRLVQPFRATIARNPEWRQVRRRRPPHRSRQAGDPLLSPSRGRADPPSRAARAGPCRDRHPPLPPVYGISHANERAQCPARDDCRNQARYSHGRDCGGSRPGNNGVCAGHPGECPGDGTCARS